ncbi:MAG TPA: helix-turn-helix domain-containing protein [Candidatus Nanoarchaeia archaeon]|nr:helix-turn-helix domain-containing protein [Candidatus Nanoarchaeia archaeon]
MFIIDRKETGIVSLPSLELKPDALSTLSSELSQKIVSFLAKSPSYPKDIAKHLKVHEQKVYYHIHNLENSGIIKIIKKEPRQGALVNIYALSSPSFFIKFRELEATQKLANESDFLFPFIKGGILDALIIVGSPDPHGPDKARSRDGYYGMDLALFLGTFLNYVPKFNVKLDTEVREKELENSNLVIIGGPRVNMVSEKVNRKLPVRFEDSSIVSKVSGKSYQSDEIGFIVKAKSPFNPDKQILVVAGKRHSGTKAAIIAFLKNFREIRQGNKFNQKVMAKIVEGLDKDSDGIVDDVEFRE